MCSVHVATKNVFFSNAVVQGQSFINAIDSVWTKRSVSDGNLKTQFKSECQKWVLLLLQLIDITKPEAVTHLHEFVRPKGKGVLKMYRQDINETVSDTTPNGNERH